MRNPPEKTAGSIRRLRLPALGALMAVLALFVARVMGKSALYGFAQLLPIALFAIQDEAGVPRRAGICAGAVLLYGFLGRLLYQETIPLLVFLFSAVSIALSAAPAGRLSRDLHEKQRHYTEQSAQEQLVAEINTHLLAATTQEQLYRQTLRSLYNFSGRPGVFFIRGRDGSLRHAASYPSGLILYAAEVSAAEEAFFQAAETGYGTPRHRGSSFRYLPIRLGGEIAGVVGILMNPEAPLSPSMLRMVRQMLVRVALVLEKQRLAERHQEALVEGELEQMRSNFLRAISHDFRTPLTSIICACSALGGQDVALDAQARREMIDSIGEEAEWLLRMVENLLSVTRADGGGPRLSRTLESVEEVLSGIIEKTQARFPDTVLTLKLPEEFLMLPMDPMLIMQVLMNLIENAVKYAPESKRIELTVESLPDCARLSVRDFGKGLVAKDAESLFAQSPARDGGARGGMGMGLTICRSVIRAHGGEIWADNHPEGGARFSFTLPKEAQ